MIKKLTLMFVLTAIMICGIGASKSSAQVIDPGDYNDVRLAGLGISVGYYGYGLAGTRSLSIPPLNLYYEMGVHDKITVGPFLSYARWSFRYTGFGSDYRYNWSFLSVGGRGSYHATSIINEWFDAEIDENTWDIYGTLFVGLEFRSYNHTGDSFFDTDPANSVHFFIGPVLGARYYLNDRFSIYAESGRGALGVLTLGVSTRL